MQRPVRSPPGSPGAHKSSTSLSNAGQRFLSERRRARPAPRRHVASPRQRTMVAARAVGAARSARGGPSAKTRPYRDESRAVLGSALTSVDTCIGDAVIAWAAVTGVSAWPRTALRRRRRCNDRSGFSSAEQRTIAAATGPRGSGLRLAGCRAGEEACKIRHLHTRGPVEPAGSEAASDDQVAHVRASEMSPKGRFADSRAVGQ